MFLNMHKFAYYNIPKFSTEFPNLSDICGFDFTESCSKFCGLDTLETKFETQMKIRESIETIKTIEDVVSLISDISCKTNSTELLCSYLTEVFDNFPVREEEMRKFSMLYQSCEGSHGRENYATLTLFLCACESILTRETTLKEINEVLKSMKELQLKMAQSP